MYGTRQRAWLDVFLYTGLPRGDASRLGRQHMRSGIAKLHIEKSQDEIEVGFPILSVLQRTLDVDPIGELAFCIGARGQPFAKESLGNAFSEAAR